MEDNNGKQNFEKNKFFNVCSIVLVYALNTKRVETAFLNINKE